MNNSSEHLGDIDVLYDRLIAIYPSTRAPDPSSHAELIAEGKQLAEQCLDHLYGVLSSMPPRRRKNVAYVALHLNIQIKTYLSDLTAAQPAVLSEVIVEQRKIQVNTTALTQLQKRMASVLPLSLHMLHVIAVCHELFHIFLNDVRCARSELQTPQSTHKNLIEEIAAREFTRRYLGLDFNPAILDLTYAE
ncbi:hypothetical protein ES707_11855 [subsurface metagenome]